MRERLTHHEILTIIISSVALIASFSGIFFSHFYASHQLEAVVLQADPAGGDLVYQVAIINSGNRKALITEAWLGLNSGDNELHGSNPFGSIELQSTLPVVIDDKSIVLLTFKGPLSFQKLYKRGGEPDLGSGLEEFDGEETRKIRVTAGFLSMDFKGVVYRADTGVMSAHITTKNVAEWHHDGAKRSLFIK